MFLSMCCSYGSSKISRTMCIKGNDKTICIVEILFPAIGNYDILVEVQYATLTINDARKYVSGATFLPGQAYSGIVKEAGKKSGYKIGESVYGWIDEGALSEYIVTSSKNVAKVPEWLKIHVGATIPYIGWIAYKIFIEGDHINADTKVHVNAEGILNNILSQIARQYTLHVTSR